MTRGDVHDACCEVETPHARLLVREQDVASPARLIEPQAEQPLLCIGDDFRKTDLPVLPA